MSLIRRLMRSGLWRFSFPGPRAPALFQSAPTSSALLLQEYVVFVLDERLNFEVAESGGGGAEAEAEAEDTATRRKRLLYQSKKRGILENDILLGDFAQQHIQSLSETELADFDRLINGDHNEWDLYYWLSDTEEPPAEVQTPVFNKLKTFCWSDSRPFFRYKKQTVHVIK